MTSRRWLGAFVFGVGALVLVARLARSTEREAHPASHRAATATRVDVRSPATASRPTHESPPPSVPVHAALADATAPFDLQAAIDVARFGFAEGGTTHTTDQHVYRAEVHDDGHIALRGRTSGPEGDETRPLTVRTRSVAREGGATPTGASAVRRANDGHLERDLDGVVENVHANDQGLEQSWSFEREPAGSGPLVVSLDVSGARFVSATAGGLHFRDPNEDSGYRYGHGTFVDARGARTAVPATYEHGVVELRVPADVLRAAAYPAVLDPVISPERTLDQPIYMEHGANQTVARLAWNGSVYLAVWIDNRTATYTYRVAGTRLSPTGQVLDHGGFTVSTDVDNGGSDPLDVATNGTDFLVAFASDSGDDVRFRRVSAAGAIVDATDKSLGTVSGSELHVDVASDGTDYFIVWTHRPNFGLPSVKGARVTSAGVNLDPAGFDLPATGVVAEHPEVAHTASGYLVAYVEGTNTKVVRTITVASDRTLGTPQTVSTGGVDGGALGLGSNGGGYLVVWQYAPSSGGDNLYGRLLGVDGTPQAATFPVVTDADNQTTPVVHPLGSDYAVLFTSSNANWGPYPLYVKRVTSAGAVLDAGLGLLVATLPDTQFGVAGDATTFLVAHDDDASCLLTGTGTDAICSTQVVSTGTALGASMQVVSDVAAGGTDYVRAAFNGSHFLAAWKTPIAVQCMRLSPDGQPADAAPTTLATGTVAEVRVASNGTDFLVGYTRSGSKGFRVGADGTVLDAAELVLGGGTTNGTLVSDGADYVAFYATAGNIVARRITSAGVVDAAATTIRDNANTLANPAVSWNGTNYLVVFEEVGNLTGQRVSPALAVLDATGFTVSAAAGSQLRPAVASNGTDWLVVWDDDRVATGVTDIRGTRVAASGFIVDATNLIVSDATGNQTSPVVTWNASDYLVAWHDARTASAVYGTLVATTGTVDVPSTGTLLAGTTATYTRIGLTPGLPLTTLVSYIRTDSLSPYLGATSARVRLVSFSSGLGAICTSGADCNSGNCIDGVCCNVACAGGTTDCLACSIAAGAPADGTCAVVTFASSTVCRVPSDACDAPEVCTGFSPSCPADQRASSGTVCRAALGPCDVAETCDGVAVACPADAIEPSGIACRAATGPCDVAETCDGVNGGCPTDLVRTSGSVCRTSVSACDLAEVCDGYGVACPGDGVLPSGTPCRDSQGTCDVPESCNGVSATCPLDQFFGNLVQCDTAHGVCDFADYCTGTGPACPELTVADGTTCDDSLPCSTGDTCQAGVCASSGVASSGTVCRAALGACDIAETCDGSTTACPTDALEPNVTTCRPSGGPCDPAEYCSGDLATCPADAKQPAGTVCRVAKSQCDVAEACDGFGALCPIDLFEPPTVQCRGSAGQCDAVEMCPGNSPYCPGDIGVPDGTSCDDALTCTATSACRLGVCQPDLTLDCSDGNPCTTDTCGEPGGCAHAVIASCTTDASVPRDASMSNDASAQDDAGSTPPPPTAASGCSCRVARGTAAPWWSVVLVLGVFARWRRRTGARVSRRA